MFGLFKKKKKSIPEMPISEAIIECKKQGAKSVSINLYIEDQILFQVMLAKHFKGKGLESDNSDDMAVVHFFNTNKTLTHDTWEKFKLETKRLRKRKEELPRSQELSLSGVRWFLIVNGPETGMRS